MRRIVAFEHVTLDGFASSGQGMGFEWTFRGYSDELAEYVQEDVQSDFDTVVYGRETYLGMYGFWGNQPTTESTPQERKHAEWVNAVDKIVCSTTLEAAEWNNTRVVGNDLAAEFTRLKAQPGGTIAIYASPKLVHSFIDLKLIDEFRLFVHPVVIGSGTPLFHDRSAFELQLLDAKPFETGVVYVRYQIA